MKAQINLFDINSTAAFYRTICRNVQILRNAEAKETERLLFVIFGLNQLREWISPRSRQERRNPSPTPGQRFYDAVFELGSFKVINAICNHTKHLQPLPKRIDTSYGLSIDEWPDVGAVHSFDNGPPSGYSIDGRDVLDVVEEVLRFYEDNWFSKQEQPGRNYGVR